MSLCFDHGSRLSDYLATSSKVVVKDFYFTHDDIKMTSSDGIAFGISEAHMRNIGTVFTKMPQALTRVWELTDLGFETAEVLRIVLHLTMPNLDTSVPEVAALLNTVLLFGSRKMDLSVLPTNLRTESNYIHFRMLSVFSCSIPTPVLRLALRFFEKWDTPLELVRARLTSILTPAMPVTSPKEVYLVAAQFGLHSVATTAVGYGTRALGFRTVAADGQARVSDLVSALAAGGHLNHVHALYCAHIAELQGYTVASIAEDHQRRIGLLEAARSTQERDMLAFVSDPSI